MKPIIQATLAFLLLAVSQTAFAKTIYVDAANNGTANGKEWTTAYKTVKAALAEAAVLAESEPFVEVWLKAGIYKEGEPLRMINKVRIRGGFAGTETAISQRGSSNVTVLDGGYVEGDPDSGHRVFVNEFTEEAQLDSSAVLDSVTIKNGYEEIHYEYEDWGFSVGGDCGGGMYNCYASPTITNCTFSGNEAFQGGGILNECSNPIIVNCTFNGNAAYFGGAIFNADSNPTITNCTFNGNEAGDSGGGMYNAGGSPIIINCTFSGNTANYQGGGIHNISSSSTITNCTFNGNKAVQGGGIFDVSLGSTINNCTFSANQANVGGGMYTHRSNPTITNCTFSGNQANNGGGLGNSWSSNPAVINCTFSGNTATYSGGGIYNFFDSNPIITNCIIWGNTPTTQIINESSTPRVSYSIVQGGYTGTGNITTNPSLSALASNGGVVQTMAVSGSSSAVNAGSTHTQATSLGVALPTTDARGYIRSMGTNQCQTIGAYDPNATVPKRIISVSSDSLAFGNVTKGEIDTKTFIISNTGDSELRVYFIEYPAGFRGNWSGGTIAAGGSQTVTVTFAPTIVNSYNGTVTVVSDSTSGTSTLPISGTGVTVPTRVIVISPASLSFGNVGIEHTKTGTFNISNIGNNELTVNSISYPTGFSGDWSGGMIEAGNSQTVTVVFTPTSMSNYSGTVMVNSDSTSGTNTLTVSGTGAAPTRIIGVSPSNLPFGDVMVGQTKISAFTIRNTGNSKLTVDSISYPVGFNGDDWSGTIAVGGSQTITVAFEPTDTGIYNGIVTVITNSTSGTSTLPISGTGVTVPTRVIGVSPVNLSFGRVGVGQAANRTFSIKNTGNSELAVNSSSYPTGFSGDWSGTIAIGGSQNITVTFTPTDEITYNGSVVVVSDSTNGTNTLILSGRGGTTTAEPTLVTERPPLSVYETKVSARTSVIKEMSVKIEYRDPANGLLKTKNFPVHYRAPVTKSYTILMAYDGDGSTVYPNTGSGRMWTAGLKPAFKFGGESYLHKGWTAEGIPSHIGAKRQNIPEQGSYYNAAVPNSPEIHFTGLATLDWKNGGRVASSAGVVYGKNFAPLRCSKHTTLEQGLTEPWEAAMTLGWESKSLYYPQPCYVEGSGGSGDGDMKEAHFHGTYKTRYHAKRSKDLYWPMVNTQMDTLWVPKANR